MKSYKYQRTFWSTIRDVQSIIVFVVSGIFGAVYAMAKTAFPILGALAALKYLIG